MKREANILLSILWVIIFIFYIAIFFVDTTNMRDKITMLALGLYSVCVAYDSIKSIIFGKDYKYSVTNHYTYKICRLYLI